MAHINEGWNNRMSLWWAKRNQLDDAQVELIEDLTTDENHLVKGPPGSGKTNVLLRRAQFVRAEGMPRVMVLSFTRPLVEFVKTGCYNSSGKEIFPVSLVETVETWLRWIHSEHGEALPPRPKGKDAFAVWKERLAVSAKKLASRGHLPKYETIFVDEAQDLQKAEVEALLEWTETLYFVGDSQQQIYNQSVGLSEIVKHVPDKNIHTLPSHYRVAPQIAKIADRILTSTGTASFASTGFYKGPKPGRYDDHGPLSRKAQIAECARQIKEQLRLYGDFINDGDRIGIIVPMRDDRDEVLEYLEGDPDLIGMSRIIRARNGEKSDEYQVGFDNSPITIVTVQGCKGLEFRTVHWLFCDENSWAYSHEHYYTVVTRAKTEMDVYYESKLPQELALAHSKAQDDLWA